MHRTCTNALRVDTQSSRINQFQKMGKMVKQNATTKRFTMGIKGKYMSEIISKVLKEEHVRYGEARFQGSHFVRPFVERIYQDIEECTKTSCHGCKYDDIDTDENERKTHCIPCLEPITLRKNYTASST